MSPSFHPWDDPYLETPPPLTQLPLMCQSTPPDVCMLSLLVNPTLVTSLYSTNTCRVNVLQCLLAPVCLRPKSQMTLSLSGVASEVGRLPHSSAFPHWLLERTNWHVRLPFPCCFELHLLQTSGLLKKHFWSWVSGGEVRLWVPSPRGLMP